MPHPSLNLDKTIQDFQGKTAINVLLTTKKRTVQTMRRWQRS
jgi:hypothetical protein